MLVSGSVLTFLGLKKISMGKPSRCSKIQQRLMDPGTKFCTTSEAMILPYGPWSSCNVRKSWVVILSHALGFLGGDLSGVILHLGGSRGERVDELMELPGLFFLVFWGVWGNWDNSTEKNSP